MWNGAQKLLPIYIHRELHARAVTCRDLDLDQLHLRLRGRLDFVVIHSVDVFLRLHPRKER
jgi:hypothetical protein